MPNLNLKTPSHTGSETPSQVLSDLKSDMQALESSNNDIEARQQIVDDDAQQVAADKAAVAADRTAVAQDKAATEAARDEAVTTKLFASGTATGGSATTVTDSGQSWDVDVLAGLLLKVIRNGAVVRQASIVSNTATTITVASGAAIQAGDAYEVYTKWQQTLQNVLSVAGDYGVVGNIQSPLVDLPLNQIETMPFAAATASAAIPAATDVAGWAGLLRTTTVSFNVIPDGVQAGQYAIIGGVEYPITVVDAVNNTITLEYHPGIADPTGTPLVTFAMWRFAGRYSGLSTFSRSSRKTFIDPLSGLVRGCPAGFPAFERMADGGVGILLEGLSTNNLLNSLDASTETISGCTVSVNTQISPIGSMDADTIVEDTVSSWKVISIGGGTYTAGSYVTFSRFLKAGARSWAGLTLNGGGAAYLHTSFDLANGVVGTVPNGITARIIPFKNGWYRCMVTFQVTVTGNITCLTYVYNSQTPGPYVGTGANAIYVWHKQAENLPFATSVIPTGAVGVTRAYDLLSIPVSGNKLHRNDPMTYVIDVDLYGNDTAMNQYPFNVSGGNQDSIHIQTNLAVSSYWGGAYVHGAPNDVSIGKVHRLALRSDGLTFGTFVDGSRNNTPIPIGGSQVNESVIYIGSGGLGSGCLFGHARGLRVYGPLTDSVIAAA